MGIYMGSILVYFNLVHYIVLYRTSVGITYAFENEGVRLIEQVQKTCYDLYDHILVITVRHLFASHSRSKIYKR